MNIKEYVSLHKEGFTIDLKGNPTSFNEGFQVGLTDNVCTLDNIDFQFIQLCKIAHKLTADTFIGGWADGDKFYLDISIWIPDEITARAMGNLFNQKAIWDWSNSQCIEI